MTMLMVLMMKRGSGDDLQRWRRRLKDDGDEDLTSSAAKTMRLVVIPRLGCGGVEDLWGCSKTRRVKMMAVRSIRSDLTARLVATVKQSARARGSDGDDDWF